MTPKALSLMAAATVLTVTSAALVAAHSGAANAASQPRLKVVVEQYRLGDVQVAAPSARDKRSVTLTPLAPVSEQAVQHQLAASTAEPAQQSSFSQWLHPSGDKQISPPGGSAGDLRATGQSFVLVPVLPYFAVFTQNSSEVSWLGSQPSVADSISQTDDWQVSFFGDQFEAVDAPPGSTTSADGSEVSWTTTTQDNWYSEHSWDELIFEPVGFGYLYRIQYAVTGTFQFGSSFFTVTGDSRSFVS